MNLIYGCGAMAKVLHAYRPAHAFAVDLNFMPDERRFSGKPVIPFEELQQHCNPRNWDVFLAVGYARMNALRAERFQTLQEWGYKICSYVHGSVIKNDATIGEGSVLLDTITLHPDTLIGKGVWMTGHNAIGHDCHIHHFCWINSGVILAGGVEIGERSFLGVGATVAHGVKIGKRNFIGANTHIAHDTHDDGVWIAESGKKFPMKPNDFLEFIE